MTDKSLTRRGILGAAGAALAIPLVPVRDASEGA